MASVANRSDCAVRNDAGPESSALKARPYQPEPQEAAPHLIDRVVEFADLAKYPGRDFDLAGRFASIRYEWVGERKENPLLYFW